ncbi:MAG: DUF6868 family protein [Planctomycetota bacterium]|jgi:hypothetical protein
MTFEQLTDFFMWCTIIGGGLLVVSSLMCMAMKNMIAKIHGKFFGIGPEATKTAVYGYIGLFKILWLVFAVIPWIALLIVDCGCWK